jgi:hypothetical protein
MKLDQNMTKEFQTTEVFRLKDYFKQLKEP